MTTPIRPNSTPGSASPAKPDAARLAAQKAFFQTALANSQGAGLSARPTAAAPFAAQKIPGVLPAEPPTRILRPGSLLDIKI